MAVPRILRYLCALKWKKLTFRVAMNRPYQLTRAGWQSTLSMTGVWYILAWSLIMDMLCTQTGLTWLGGTHANNRFWFPNPPKPRMLLWLVLARPDYLCTMSWENLCKCLNPSQSTWTTKKQCSWHPTWSPNRGLSTSTWSTVKYGTTYHRVCKQCHEHDICHDQWAGEGWG